MNYWKAHQNHDRHFRIHTKPKSKYIYINTKDCTCLDYNINLWSFFILSRLRDNLRLPNKICIHLYPRHAQKLSEIKPRTKRDLKLRTMKCLQRETFWDGRRALSQSEHKEFTLWFKKKLLGQLLVKRQFPWLIAWFPQRYM